MKTQSLAAACSKAYLEDLNDRNVASLDAGYLRQSERFDHEGATYRLVEFTPVGGRTKLELYRLEDGVEMFAGYVVR